jgi:hypothetical protein
METCEFYRILVWTWGVLVVFFIFTTGICLVQLYKTLPYVGLYKQLKDEKERNQKRRLRWKNCNETCEPAMTDNALLPNCFVNPRKYPHPAAGEVAMDDTNNVNLQPI